MEKKTVAAFFDSCAGWWDADMIRNEAVITQILDNAGIRPGIQVLDVACGTGVLFPDYLSRQVQSVTGIDISPEMAKIAAGKFPQVEVICGDVEETAFDRQFDAVVVYNAFPHFPNPEKLIEVLAGLCRPGGRLMIAHGMSRQALQSHHAGRASQVSIDLIHEQELADLMHPWFEVDVIISNEKTYQVCGKRRESKTDKPRVREEKDMAEMLALMKYMVSHNDAHAQELTELAQRLKKAGRESVCRKIMDAVASFDVANTQLSDALDALTEDTL